MKEDATRRAQTSAPKTLRHDNLPNDGQKSRQYVLGLLVDPGVPERIAQGMTKDDFLAQWLSKHGRGNPWRVEWVKRPLMLDERGHMPILEHGREALAEKPWDAVILVTDLPRHSENWPIAADYSTTEHVGMVSVPALGSVNQRRRAREMIGHLVLEHLSPAISSAQRIGGEDDDAGSCDSEVPAGQHGRPGHVHRLRVPVRHVESTQESIDEHIALVGVRGRLRLLAGMVRANRPWRLVPSLAPAMAGAGAGAAFGVFYSNIWMLADAFTVPRLLLVNIVAMLAMITWLIAYNSLWEQPFDATHREQAVLSNTTTVVTVSVAVVYVYALLFAVTLLVSFAVIPSPFMQTILTHPVGLNDYVGLAWLAASMGTIAGALGSGLSDEEAVRQAAYSRRENQRRQRQEAKQSEAEAE